MTTADLHKLGYAVVGNRAVRLEKVREESLRVKAKCQPQPSRIVRAFVPTPIVSTANRREHWTKRHGRNTEQARAVSAAMGNDIIGRGQPKSVTFVLLTAHPLDDDNLRSALKACRDAIAKLCGFDDAVPVWKYEQRRREHYEPVGCFVKVEW